jgi:hypothetical protein
MNKNSEPILGRKVLHKLSTNKFLAGWYGAGMTCILLAINRFCEMLAPRISTILFSGKRVYIWLSVPIIYMFFTFSQTSAVYNTKYYAFNYPFFGEEGWKIMQVLSEPSDRF